MKRKSLVIFLDQIFRAFVYLCVSLNETFGGGGGVVMLMLMRNLYRNMGVGQYEVREWKKKHLEEEV